MFHKDKDMCHVLLYSWCLKQFHILAQCSVTISWMNKYVISDFTFPSESWDYLCFILETETGRNHVIFQDYPTSKGQWQDSSPGLLVHLPSVASICFSCHLQCFYMWSSPVLCALITTQIGYYICRRDAPCVSGPPLCKVGSQTPWPSEYP